MFEAFEKKVNEIAEKVEIVDTRVAEIVTTTNGNTGLIFGLAAGILINMLLTLAALIYAGSAYQELQKVNQYIESKQR